MKRISAAAIAVACFILLSSSRLPDLIQEAEQRAVWVETEKGFGSGVIVQSGQVLTNRHVVEGARRIRVNGADSRLLREDDLADLALLASSTPELSRVRIQTRTAVQENVFYVGNPAGIRNYVGQGRILGYPEGRIYSSAFGWPGFSGSGLYNHSGELIGIQVEFVVRLGTKSPPEGRAVPAEAVKRFMNW